MSRHTMSKGMMTKGQKGVARRAAAQQIPPPPATTTTTTSVLNNKEHNNNTSSSSSSSKGNPSSQPQSSVPTSKTTTSSAKVLKEGGNKNSSSSLPPAAPSSSPIPPDDPAAEDELLDVEELDVEVVDDDDDDDDDEECEEEEDDEEGDEDDEEYDNDTEPCETRVTPGKRGPPNNPSYNSRSFTHSSSEEDDEDEGEGDDSLDREESDDEDEDEDEDGLEPPGFLLNADGDPSIQGIPPDAQARLEAFFEAAVGFTDGKLMSDPENLRKLTLTVSSALGEASAAINRMRDSQRRKSLEEGRNDSMEEGDSLLALACSSGYFELARVLLAMGANVDDRGSKGDLTPLMDAASQGHVEIVKLLISHGAEVNAQSACGNSPLMYASAAGHDDIVKELLKAGARVEDNNENGHTPLMESASSGHTGVAKILLDNGAGINTASNEFKESALTVACYKGHLEMVRFLLASGADQQHKTDEMHTALMEASMDGHVEVAKLLLDCGAQVNMPVDSFESPLTLAACGGHVELAQLLIDRGANIEEVNDEGYTPLMESSREGHIQVVKCLIAAGAKVNAETDETHETALTLSACGGFLEAVDTLVNKGADIELGASTPLMEASQEGHYQVVKYLLDKNAQIHRETQTGDTALSYASENGHVDVVQLLVENGANPEHLSEGGRTPLMKACRGGHVDVIKFLLTRGVDVNRQTASNDHTPLSLASAGGHLAAVEVLLTAGANPYHKLKDNSTMIIEAARGGHTSCIRAILDHEKKLSEKGQAPVPGGKGGKGAAQAKAVPADSTKTNANATNQQGKSVLRKSRSTSTLDSSQSNEKTKKVDVSASPASNTTNTDAIAKSLSKLPPPNIMTPIPDSPILKSLNQTLPLGDGKVASTTPAGDDIRKKPVPGLPSGKQQQQTVITQHQHDKSGGNLKAATASQVQSQNQANACTECNTTSSSTPSSNIAVPSIIPKTPEQPHGVTKRAAAADISPGSATSSTTSPSSNTTSPGGPPLVPSQVTAATAISERPKVKANKPSARKQLQQQIQQQLQQQSQSPSALVSSSAVGAVSPNNGGVVVVGGGAKAAPLLTTLANPSPPPTVPFIPGLPTQMLQMQVQQIFTQHQSQLIYQQGNPGDRKFECFESGVGAAAALAYDNPEITAADFAQVLAAAGTFTAQQQQQLPPSSSSVIIPAPPPGTTTTTTTTTVVVTHGNGETETIMEGELPPGANEMIMTAATAAFPLDCQGQVQVASYQVSSPISVGVTELPPTSLTTTTMHTTTIINSAGGGSQILLPHPTRHPPPLPVAFSEAAAAAGLRIPSGAPPSKQPNKTLSGKMAQAQTQTTPIVKDPRPGPPAPSKPPSASSVAATAVPKKQTAKRTRPFSQGPQGHNHHGGPCPNNHKGCGGHTNAVGTQTPGAAVDKNAKALDVDSATESSGETSLSIAAGQGHLEVVEFLLERNASIEHRDKKGCTPLILAADGGHEKVVDRLISQGADVEAQSERTKDTALSLACTKGRYEVVELLLKRGANKEHRNVSDYTPLSLAASGGFVNIIKLLLQTGAEINSRTGSKLGISPLMLAAMNGNTSAVRLLLDMGSDINAQIETNKNTALTLACFQGRHEVVSLLLERKANLEHRAKTGLTPLMEAANGGYVEVGRVLLEKGADVNAPPVPATRDTALTIAADKGHFRFVEMLLGAAANVEVRNKKGCTPLWLSCNGGHLDVCQALQRAGADVDAQDNRRISCLMASFKKGHVKVVRWIVKYVKQFPGDSEMSRYFIGLANEAELLKRAQQCMEYIKQAKDKQALEASKNANILLEELELEKCREESKKAAAAKRREKKKKKKAEKKQLNDDGDGDNDDEDDNDIDVEDAQEPVEDLNPLGSHSSSLDKKQQAMKGSKGNKGNKENVQVPAHTPPVVVSVVVESNNNNKKDKPSSREPEPLPIIESSNAASSKVKDTNDSSSNAKNAKKKKSNHNKVAKSSSSDAVGVDSQIPPHQLSTNTASAVDPPSSKSAPFSSSNEKDVTGKKSSNGKHDKDVLKEKVKEVEDVYGKGKNGSNKERKNKENAEEKKNLKDESSSQSSTTNTKESSANHHHHLHNSAPTNANKGTSHVTPSKKGKASAASITSTNSDLGQGPEPLMNISLNPPHSHSNRKGGVSNSGGGAYEHEIHNTFPHNNYASTIMTPSSPSSTAPNLTASSATTSATSPSSASAAVVGSTLSNKSPSQPNKPSGRKDDGWKEVTRSCPSSRSKKVMVPSTVISRVIGRGGCNINAIREATNAHIEVEKQQKGQVQPERSIQIKGTSEATKQAFNLITALMNEPDVDIKKLIPQHVRPSGASAASSGASGGASTPTPILSNANAFPVIGSASAPLPPIGQTMTASSNTGSFTSAATSAPMTIGSTAGVIEAKSASSFSKKGSPTPKVIAANSSVSPPLSYMIKSGSGSPPIKKPSVVSTNAGNFEIGNFSVSEVPAEIYSKNYTGKKSMVFTNSGNGNNNSTSSSSNSTTSSVPGGGSSSYPSKHHHHQQVDSSQGSGGNNWGDTKPRNATPTLNMSNEMKQQPFNASTVHPSVAVPSGSPPLLGNQQRQQQHHQQQQQAPQSFSHGKEQHQQQQHHETGNQFGPNNMNPHVNGPNVNAPPSMGDAYPAPITVQRNLAPGSQPIGSNRTTIGTERSPSEASNNQDSSQPPQPLEYSPFNYTFSKTSGWFPGDLAVREPSSQSGGHPLASSFGPSNLISSLTAGGSTSALSSSAAARAMNFASVAASGTTTTAQMTQAGGITSIGKPLMGDVPMSHHHQQQQLPLQNQGQGGQIDQGLDQKADAAKAPGYRGNTSMGSPVMRMPHPQQPTPQQMNPHDRFNLDMNNQMSFNPRSAGPNYSAGPFQPQDMGLINSHQPVNGGNHMLYQQQQNNSGGAPNLPIVVQQLLPQPHSIIPHPTHPPHGVVNHHPHPPPLVPTNVVLSSRLNPRAASFLVKVAPGQQQQQQQPLSINQQHQQPPPPPNSAFASTQQLGQNAFMQQYNKGMGGGHQQLQQQQGYGQQQQQQQSRRLGSNWGGYTNGSLEDIPGFQNLAGPGIMDPAALIGGLGDNMHDNQNPMKVDRLPRPIGGERTWKGSSSSSGQQAVGGGVGGGGVNLPFAMDGLDPAAGWLGMYGSSNQQQGFPTGANQGLPHPPRVGGGDRGGIGRRYMEDLDANRILEMQQQMYDGQQRQQQLMNGVNQIPQMMHMQNPLPPQPPGGMYPYGLEHMDQQQQHQIPKLEQQWESHLLMDDKHVQGWGSNSKWGT
ncbi:ankyrin repeat domain-containing protein 17 isoform X5 [Folsomia candida]|uniref:ankyrin repeat domain-containing protein 17 isoform X5 n=1 Tax=Folsomia candida TaxID=158441 RepID=UPI00160511B4|nr:ankyrin repeat domain-containing protein 17 isoform X5 [Folsomia candida]